MPSKKSPPSETPPAEVVLPDKEYFKIGEVARLVGVEPYVLRFWESEFKRDIRPERTRSNQRMYRRRDVETFLEIKRLRYDEKLELSGARRRLRRPEAASSTRAPRLDDAVPELPFSSLATQPMQASQGAPGIEAGAGVAFSGITTAQRDRMQKGLEELLRIVDEDEGGG